MSESIGAVIKEARRRRGLRVKDIAARTSARISPSYLSCIENDLRLPSEELLLELAELPRAQVGQGHSLAPLLLGGGGW